MHDGKEGIISFVVWEHLWIAVQHALGVSRLGDLRYYSYIMVFSSQPHPLRFHKTRHQAHFLAMTVTLFSCWTLCLILYACLVTSENWTCELLCHSRGRQGQAAHFTCQCDSEWESFT